MSFQEFLRPPFFLTAAPPSSPSTKTPNERNKHTHTHKKRRILFLFLDRCLSVRDCVLCEKQDSMASQEVSNLSGLASVVVL